MLNFILTDDTITVFANGKIHTLTNTERTWTRALKALHERDDQALLDAVNRIDTLTRFCHKNDVVIEDSKITYRGRELHNCLTERLRKMAEDGMDIKPLANFLANVMENPSNRSVEELYSFLEHNNLPITPDGCFIAYKRIRDDWKDCHSGTIDNSIGQIPSMPRNAVDDNPNNTCSHGLHVCSIEYLKNFWGDRLIAVKVNPADVVSVPIDYHNTKMRVARYEVIEELDIKTVKEVDDKWEPIYDPEEEEEEKELVDFDEIVEEIYNLRELHDFGCYGLM